MEKEFSYTFRKSKRAGRVRIIGQVEWSVVVKNPRGICQSIIDRFVSDKTQWVMKKISFFNSIDRKAIRVFSHEDYLKHKDEAFALVKERVEFYNKIYCYSFNKICIRNQKTRWGSCSSRQNLNLNYRILFLHRDLRDYIIVHEICHLKELNHSQNFWSLVRKTFPNYLEIRRELRKQGLFYR